MDIMDDFPDDFGNEKPNIYYKCSDEDCNHTRVVHDYYHMVCTLHDGYYPLMTLDGKDKNKEIYTEEDYLPEDQRREILSIITKSFTKKLSGNKYFRTLGDFWKKNGFQKYADEAYGYIKD
jgi:hypothetical protein